MAEKLYCLGCGIFVIESAPGHLLAISCRCGADSPILCKENGTIYSLPSSLYGISKVKGPKAHIEHYLGFSDHKSAAKDLYRDALTTRGLAPFADCDEAKCQQYAARKREEVLLGKQTMTPSATGRGNGHKTEDSIEP